MKKRKLFLLVAIVALALFMVACDDEEPATPPEVVGPEYFSFETPEALSNIYQLEGTLESYNEEFNVVALRSEQLDAQLGISSSVSIYDLTTGMLVHRIDDQKSYYSGFVSYRVSLDYYPVIETSVSYYDTDEDGNEFLRTKYSYCMRTDIGITSLGLESEDQIKAATVSNMYVYGISDTIFWINRDFEIVRRTNADISGSYTSFYSLVNYFGIDAEFGGYLYTWEFTQTSRDILVYDKNGVCITKYSFPEKTMAFIDGDYDSSIINPKVFVLNNGNLLVQVCTEAEEDATTWDITYSGMRFNVSTAIVNYVTGEATAIDCNFIVCELESAYARFNSTKSDFAFKLAEGYENQAYIVKFANGYLDDELYYTVMDNSLNIEYTLNNAYLAKLCAYEINVDTIAPDGYVATVWDNGTYVDYKFDYEGRVIGMVGATYSEVFGGYYVTDIGIYTLGGECKFNFEENGFVPNLTGIGRHSSVANVSNGNVYLSKMNFQTGGYEIYALNTTDWTTTLMMDGVDTFYFEDGEGYLITYNEDTDVSSLYNANNELILKVRGEMELTACEDCVFVTVTVGNQDYLYAINTHAVNAKQ